MKNLFLVFIGSGLGGVLRYLISNLFDRESQSFPYQTLIANIVACLILGIFVSRTDLLDNDTYRKLIALGFCGGLSTYSTYALESFNMLSVGSFITAFVYTVVTLGLCLAALFVGFYISK